MFSRSFWKDTKNQEYATKLTLIGVFLTIFTAYTSRMTALEAKHKYKISPFELAQLSFATYRLGRLVAYDRVFEPIRAPFAKTVPDQTGAGESVEPIRGNGLRESLGQLLACPICAGTWIAAGLVYGLNSLPNPTRVFLAILSSIGAAEFLDALTEGFSWLGQAARKEAGEKHPHPLDR